MTKNVLILGASGTIARIVVQDLLAQVGEDITK
jgi:saccharopine dehydrogenase-like NADP-dependent oxidoreductase